MSPKKSVEKLVVKERTEDRTLFIEFMKGFRLLTETILFISIGAVATAWEKIRKILKSSNDDQPKRPLPPVRLIDSPAPEKIAVKVIAPLLPINDYQQLTAEQAVKRMKGLSPNQLEAVRRFENAHKKRKSVLEGINRLLNREES
jgi:hypothetical protein